MPQTRYSAKIEVLSFHSVRVAETSTNATTVVISNHGMSDNDFMYNFTRSNKPPDYMNGDTCRRKCINVTTSQFEVTTSIASQGQYDVIFLYKFTDVTQYLLDGTLSMTLQTQGEDEASFDMVATYTPGKGFYTTHGNNSTSIFNILEVLNMSNQTWSSDTADGYFRYRHNTEGDRASGKLWTMLGQSSGGTTTMMTATSEYVISTDSWAGKTNFPSTPRTAAHAAWITNAVYVNGGVMSTASTYFDSTYKYTPSTDTWTTLLSSLDAGSSGEGIALCDCLVIAYYKRDDGVGGTEFAPDDMFYMPLNDAWSTIPVTHSSPDRCFGRSGFTIDGFKGSIIGGTTDVGGADTSATDRHTMLNFPAKTYNEAGPTPTEGMEYAGARYEQFALIAGGHNDGGYFDTSYGWNPARDNWFAITDFMAYARTGQGVGL